MRDPDIRARLVDQLRADHPDPQRNVIWPEMSVGLGASRVDVGLINGYITGYEIKSAADNLDRLPAQVVNYSRCLDRAVVVTSERRSPTIADHVPKWWGITIAYDRDGRVELDVTREPSDNPDLEPFYVAQLLWRDEAYDALEALGQHEGLKRATRWALWDHLAELPVDELRDIVRARLKARSSF